MGKAKRIVDGKRNANVPVDMSDHFYDHGNEYCRYLITDPRSDRKLKKDKDIVLAAVINNYLAIKFMDSSLNNDIDISVEVYKQNSDYIKNFSEDVQDYIKKKYK